MAYDPPSGETPIANLPGWTTQRNDYQQNAKYYAGQKFFELFGRNPTNSELTKLSAAYDAGNNIDLNLSAGNSAVSQYFDTIANSPENIAAKQQRKYQADAPKYYDEINQQFQSKLGRDATDQEKSHFGSLRATGQIDAYTIGQFIDALPENVKRQDEAFRKSLSGDLQKQDSQYYSEQILPALQRQATLQGRSLDSSGVTNSLALVAQQQNRQREGFISNLSAQQYGGSQALAQGAYQNAYGSYQGLQDYSRQRNNFLSDSFNQRMNSLQDFNMQKQAYDSYLQRYGKRGSWINDLGTSLNFANSFANLFKGTSGPTNASGGGNSQYSPGSMPGF